MTPHFQNIFCITAKIPYHGAAFNHFSIGVLDRINMDAVGPHAFTKEITQVAHLLYFIVNFCFKYFRRGHCTDIACSVHIA